MRTKVLFATAIAMVLSVSVSAQSKLPADFTHDGFVTVNVGGTLVFDGITCGQFNGGASPVIDITIGKWCTPSVGFRVGYEGFTLRNAQNWYGNSDFHVDLLWNIINTCAPYRKDRFYSIVPYGQIGFMSGSKTTTSLAGGAGLLNIFRINDRIAINLDARGTLVRGAQVGAEGLAAIGSLSVGVMVNLLSAK